MRHAIAATFLFTALLAPGTARASQQVLSFEPDSSEITFLLEATGHNVEGSLYLRDGELRLDPATGQASGTVVIDATRAESGNDSRDKTMRNKVFEVEAHPLISFGAERFEGQLPASGKGQITIHGTVSIAGGDHPLSLPVEVEVAAGRFDGTTTFTVPYVEWGMHDPSILFLRVAKEVEVTFKGQGTTSELP